MMKTLMMLALSLATFNLLALESELGDLEGQYLVGYESEIGPIPGSIISLERDGTLTLVELVNPITGEDGPFVCKGEARLVGEAVQSSIKCENGREYTQTVYSIDRSSGTDQFSAEVTSSLFPGEIAYAVFMRLTEEMREHIEEQMGPLPF
ncbi:MAG: hypothetical protein OXB88_11370 [Bacteriovoracales bacterium]|nr:hypothetical protein [Bacteriovoracales bacterium]